MLKKYLKVCGCVHGLLWWTEVSAEFFYLAASIPGTSIMTLRRRWSSYRRWMEKQRDEQINVWMNEKCNSFSHWFYDSAIEFIKSKSLWYLERKETVMCVMESHASLAQSNCSGRRWTKIRIERDKQAPQTSCPVNSTEKYLWKPGELPATDFSCITV